MADKELRERPKEDAQKTQQPMQIGDRTYYTVEAIGAKTGMHPRTIQRLLKAGILRGKKQGKRWYVSERNLQAYFDADPHPPKSPDLGEGGEGF